MRSLSRLERNSLWVLLGVVIAAVGVLALGYYEDTDCNVAYIPLEGDLITYGSEDLGTGSSSDSTASEDVTQQIRDADKDSGVKAIVLAVDSPGGSPVAGQEIETALKASSKPTVALIRDQGDSAAYMAATGANEIIASEFSDVGDIGITSSYVDESQQDAQNGLTYNQLSIGKYKDMYSPDKPLTDDERALALSQLQEYYQVFVQIVSQNRHLSIDRVTALADGSGITGQDALADGLIDKIGGLAEVESYLKSKIHKTVKVCGVDQ